ncbi:hypothetical protein [Tessaracoccus flavescens]|uniref:Uncharacterized protein n=1 Tax=Tessaracoccus flavescens TaxID=399497 RepID=A0A1Q2CXJ9_9ACTN|nr:hypothetical protein [Tessaracoccus flavescens]AQP50813.1 hypothetical protein BW733_08215 [Tessaracoccus flavescens]
MLFTRTAHPAFLDDTANFRPTDKTEIFEKLDDGYFVVALEYVLEQGESQYPLEDVLDEFRCHIEAEEVDKPENPAGRVDLFANSRLERLAGAVEKLVGRRAYNVESKDEDGDTFVSFVIDDSVSEAKL